MILIASRFALNLISQMLRKILNISFMERILYITYFVFIVFV